MKKLTTIAAVLALASLTARAQLSINATNIAQVLAVVGLVDTAQHEQLVAPGHTLNVNGQSFFVSTNADGLYTVTTAGPAGALSFTPPNNTESAIGTASQIVGQNNPANIGFYGTNELDVKVGVMYLQADGTAAAVLSVQKYGLFGNANVGVGGGLLEGNNAGQQGTAAGYGELDYRKPIGDVACTVGVVGGFDLWHRAGFGGVKGGLEYRQNAHLGEWLDVTAVAENSSHNPFPFLIGGGVTYAF